MKSAIIAAIVSAVVASGTATAAKFLVTSKDIKNGTIQLVDINPSAKAALRGRFAKATITAVRGPEVRLCPVGDASCEAGSSEASCPAGSVAISGGWAVPFGAATVRLSTWNATAGSQKSRWLVQAQNNSPTREAIFYAMAFCAS
jgi:hypothetical protein